MKKKVLVTGASGFLGSHVADVLSEIGYHVILFDRLESKYKKPEQEMIIGDILNGNLLSTLNKDIDFIFHFAGIADLDDATTKASDTAQINILGTINLLEYAQRNFVKRFIFASSLYVYSNKGGFYRCSKQAAEIYIEEFQRKFGLSYTILRFGSLYGPRANSHNSLYKAVSQAIATGKIILQNSGDEIREFIHVRDAALLTNKILSREYENKHVIISGIDRYKWDEVLVMLKEIINKDIEIVYMKENEAHYTITPYSFIPKTGIKLVSNPYTDMGEGILEIIQDIYNQKNSKD